MSADEIERLRAEARRREWRPIETAPKDGTVIDVWLQGELSDVEFYCQSPAIETASGFGGRSAGWRWREGKFRPYMKGLNLPVFIQPTHWQPLPEPPQ